MGEWDEGMVRWTDKQSPLLARQRSIRRSIVPGDWNKNMSSWYCYLHASLDNRSGEIRTEVVNVVTRGVLRGVGRGNEGGT